MRPSTSLAPLQAISKTMSRNSPYPHFFLSQQCKQVSIPSGMCSCGSQSRHPLTAALSFRIWGVLSSASMWCYTCRVTLGHGGVQGGTCPKTVASLCILQRSRSLRLSFPGHSSVQASPRNSCLVRQVPAQLHQLSPYTLYSHRATSSLSTCMASSSLYQATWHIPLSCSLPLF